MKKKKRKKDREQSEHPSIMSPGSEPVGGATWQRLGPTEGYGGHTSIETEGPLISRGTLDREQDMDWTVGFRKEDKSCSIGVQGKCSFFHLQNGCFCPTLHQNKLRRNYAGLEISTPAAGPGQRPHPLGSSGLSNGLPWSLV